MSWLDSMFKGAPARLRDHGDSISGIAYRAGDSLRDLARRYFNDGHVLSADGLRLHAEIAADMADEAADCADVVLGHEEALSKAREEVRQLRERVERLERLAGGGS